MDKFMYTVFPKIPIRIQGQIIRRPMNIMLTAEEVKTCLKHGPVKRNFVNEGNLVPVTLANLEQLHTAKYNVKSEQPVVAREFPEEDTFIGNTVVEDAPKTVEETVAEVETPAETTEVVEEVASVEEKVEDADAEPVVESETETSVEEKTDDKVEEKVEDADAEPVASVVEETTDGAEEKTTTPKKTYNRKKK